MDIGIKVNNKIGVLVTNKKLEKQIKTMLTAVAALLVILSLGIFIGFTVKGARLPQELIEATGTLLEITMAFEILLWFGTKAIKLLKDNKWTRKLEVTLTKILQRYHKSMGVLALGALLLHFSAGLNLINPFDFQHITGYIITAFVFLSMVFAMPNKKYKKQFKIIHIVTAFIAVIPFLIHG